MYFKVKGLPGAIDKTQPPVTIFFACLVMLKKLLSK